MSNTYVTVVEWTAGCDDCGAIELFESERSAQSWADEHVCEEGA